MHAGPLLFAPDATRQFGERMAATLRIQLAPRAVQAQHGVETIGKFWIALRLAANFVEQAVQGLIEAHKAGASSTLERNSSPSLATVVAIAPYF